MISPVVKNISKYTTKYYPYFNWEIIHDVEFHNYRVIAKCLCFEDIIEVGRMRTYDNRVDLTLEYSQRKHEYWLKQMVKNIVKNLNKKLREKRKT
jgi:hypothetical protein